MPSYDYKCRGNGGDLAMRTLLANTSLCDTRLDYLVPHSENAVKKYAITPTSMIGWSGYCGHCEDYGVQSTHCFDHVMTVSLDKQTLSAP